MLFKDYKHIELLEDGITISESRVKDRKLVKVKDWKPTNPFRLRVIATVRKGNKRRIKKRTYLYENINMVEALKKAAHEHDVLKDAIRKEWDAPSPIIGNIGDKDRMFTFDEAFNRSLDARKIEAEAENEVFKTYQQVKDFYKNHLEEHLGLTPLDQISTDSLNRIRANMKHKDGTPYSKRTKLAVLQQVNPVYSWFNDYSNLTVKSPAKIKRNALKKLGNERKVKVDDISPLFNAMYHYKKEPFRRIFVWLLHGRRLGEVLSLRWENINLEESGDKDSTYTITAENNKAGTDMVYILTRYQLETLPKPKKKGLVFPSITDKTTEMVQPTIANHWFKVRKTVGLWKLNDKKVLHSALHIHDIRHLIATEMLNEHNIVDEISGAVLGHTRSGVTARYAEMLTSSVNEAILKVLDGVFKGETDAI